MSACRRSATRVLAALAGAWLAVAPAAAKEPTSMSLIASPASGRMDQPVTLTALVQGLLFDASGPGKVDGGEEHSCAVTPEGGVKCWGDNSSGQLGDGTTTDRARPVSVTGTGGTGQLGGATAVAAGDYHVCALLANATVACWGSNHHGELGVATPKTVQPTPVMIPGLAGVAAITAGRSHSCALLGDGTVRCWGWNHYGQLGRGVAGAGGPTPAPVLGPAGSGLAQLGGVTAIAAGGVQTCALGAGGSVHCWGYNGEGQVGAGMASAEDVTRPVAVAGPGNSAARLAGAVSIAAGNVHSCAVLSEGSVVCWGYNESGRLGDGTADNRAFPVAVKGIGGIGELTGVVEVALGNSHSCARTVAGEVLCWGNGDSGQLGGGKPLDDSLVPVAVRNLPAAAVGLAAGGDHSCATLSGGGLRCWGRGLSGQLGDGQAELALTPGPVSAGGVPLAAQAVSAGPSATCAVVSGGVRCWGHGRDGQLGDGTTVDSAEPVAVKAGPGLPGDIAGAEQVAMGYLHGCALMENGGVKCWGQNDSGQLGNGGTQPSLVPVDVDLDGPATAITAGHEHTCAIVGAGVRCWGLGTDGQLGNDDQMNSATPVMVQGLAGKVIGLAAGENHTCAVSEVASTNLVQCWGYNGDGRLGVDYPMHVRLLTASTPAMDGILVKPVAVAAGDKHTCAVAANGLVYCWGWNIYGQLGDGTTIERSSYAPVVLGNGEVLTEAVAVSTGWAHSCARLSSGAVRCWGLNDNGQLGSGDTAPGLTPVAVLGPGGQELAATSVSAGGVHSCATTAGAVQCWGNRNHGRLGDGILGYATTPVVAGPVPTGTVTFTNRGEAIGAAALVDGVATLAPTLPANLHGLAAAWPGDASFDAPASAAIDLLVTGTPGADEIAGTAAADILVGGGGNDRILGGGGADTLDGGDGNDRILGGRGADTIDGGGGNDRILGGPGRDRLTGGAGRDRFVFRKPSDSRPKSPDVITDFKAGDRIDVSAFANAADVRFRRKGSRLEVDRNGDGRPEFAVVLKGVKRLPKGAVKAKR